jgi:hypothetical protein
MVFYPFQSQTTFGSGAQMSFCPDLPTRQVFSKAPIHFNHGQNKIMMNSYQQEQTTTFAMVRQHLKTLSNAEKKQLLSTIAEYLLFRSEVDTFLAAHFSRICTRKCFINRLSACCSREGIITFFADVVVNILVSKPREIDDLMNVLQQPNTGFKCIYLGSRGCLWRLKPIGCEMFLCDSAKNQVFEGKPQVRKQWDELVRHKKRYTWPDRPVLFDTLEKHFIRAGYSSPLMYLHNSPGLLRVKRQTNLQNRQHA